MSFRTVSAFPEFLWGKTFLHYDLIQQGLDLGSGVDLGRLSKKGTFVLAYGNSGDLSNIRAVNTDCPGRNQGPRKEAWVPLGGIVLLHLFLNDISNY